MLHALRRPLGRLIEPKEFADFTLTAKVTNDRVATCYLARGADGTRFAGHQVVLRVLFDHLAQYADHVAEFLAEGRELMAERPGLPQRVLDLGVWEDMHYWVVDRETALERCEWAEPPLVREPLPRWIEPAPIVELQTTPLIDSIWAEDLPLVRQLLADGADANEAADSDTPLQAAACRIDGAFLEAVLVAGAVSSPNALADAMACAAGAGALANVEKLVALGADINGQSAGQTPLHCAADSDAVAVVEWLIRQGADVHARGPDDWTALHFAARYRSIGAAELLVRQGADLTAMTADCCTPLDVVLRRYGVANRDCPPMADERAMAAWLRLRMAATSGAGKAP
jgi:ankyrin repeat protein